MNLTRILWIGGGSLGMLFAAKCTLAKAGEHTLLVRSIEQLQLMNEQGLKLTEGKCQRTAFLPCINQASSKYEYDWIALMVKQAHLEEQSMLRMIDELARLYPKANWVCFQNGIGHMERLTNRIPVKQLFQAVTTEAAKRNNLITVNHTGTGTTQIGAIDPKNDGLAQKKLTFVLMKAGFDVKVSKNIKQAVWKKLLINAVINPITAILRIRNGELLETPERLDWMRRLFDEGLTVAEAEGAGITPGLWEEVLLVCQKTADNHSSMLQDVLNGRRTEIDWINGSLVKLGEKHAISMPAHAAVLERMHSL